MDIKCNSIPIIFLEITFFDFILFFDICNNIIFFYFFSATRMASLCQILKSIGKMKNSGENVMALPLLEPEIFYDNHFKMLFFAISSLFELVEGNQWYILKGLRVVPDDV